MKQIVTYTAVSSLSLDDVAAQAETWNLALAYSVSSYHPASAAVFSAEFSESTELEVLVPLGGLFAESEIYDVIRRGLAPMDERLISALANENPSF